MTKKIKIKKPLKTILILMLVVLTGVSSSIFLTSCGKKEAVVEEKAKPVNPLTGIELTEGQKLPNRPVIVSTDNDSYLSRPQAGISKADILIEVPIEGGGSRYEPVYYSKLSELETVGAIRSVRPYILDIAREYNAIFVHNGQSPQAVAYFEESGVDRVATNIYFAAFHTEEKNSYRLPGNIYSTGSAILDAAETLGIGDKKETRKFTWLKKDETAAGTDCKDVIVNYADGAYNTFKYDPETKLYTKYVKDEPLVDENNNETFTCANILVQKVPFNTYDANSGRLNIDMYAGGEATMFTQGKVVEGTWERADKNSPTIFKDKDGNEFKMTPGVTAIQLIDTTVHFEY